MKYRSILLLAALFWAAVTHSQPLVDCNCLANLSVLQTNACQGIIPDLCQFSQCWLSPLPLQCSQSPAAGGQVGVGTQPISIV